MTYTPVPADQRKHQGPRFRGEEGQWWAGEWFPTLPLLPDERRQKPPETRPDDEARTHRPGCRCNVCKRPGAARLKQLEQRRQRAQR